jgi:hypothetical protein
MQKLDQFIEDNSERLINIDKSEIRELDTFFVDDDIINALKNNGRLNYKGVCVYYLGGEDEK